MKQLSLYTTSPEERYRRGVEEMAALCSGWSGRYPSDPAVAVLELAARTSHMASVAFDRVEPEHYAAYLNLLGEKPGEATQATLLARAVNRTGLYPGLRFWVDGVPFEVADTGKDVGEVAEVSLHTSQGWTRWTGPGPLEVWGDALEITLSRPIPAQEKVRLWCGVRPEPGRVPPAAETPPPVRLHALAEEDGGWREIPLEDGTCGLLKSGFWTLSAHSPWEKVRLEWRSPLEGTPQLERLALEPVHLVQGQTRSEMLELMPPFVVPERFLEGRALRFFSPWGTEGWQERTELRVQDGKVTGFVGKLPQKLRLVGKERDFFSDHTLREIAQERVLLDEVGVLPHSLQLMVEEDGVWVDCPVGKGGHARRGCWWDETRRQLCFGDGRDFAVPKGGRLTVCACVCGRGSAANGAGGALQAGETVLAALTAAHGGREAETPKDAFLRAVRERAEPMRAVTPPDFEALALRTPGLALAEARCIPHPGEAGVTVQVKPRSGPLTPWGRRCVQGWLENFRPLGVPVTVEEWR